MKPKGILLVSIFLTIFTLVIIAGVVKAVYFKPAPVTTDAQNQQLEAAYAELSQQASLKIEQANLRIEQANQELATMSDQVKQAQAKPQDPQYKFSPQAALVAASKTVGRSGIIQQEPQLVSYQGAPAYEVVFDQGKVYVDANNGQILSNTVPKLIDQEEAAQIAIQYMGGGNVYRVDLTTIKNVPVYRVLFNVGHLVFVDTHGQIVLVQKVSYTANTASVSNQGGSSAPAPAKSESEHEHDD